jgi:ParB family chromosome partitioning protein
MSKVVLGKGLGALIPGDDKKLREKKYRIVPLDQIAPNPMQPRHEFDEESLKQLAQSLKENGVIQPLVVRANGQKFTIIAGERRFRAARLAGINELPVVLYDDVDDTRMLELALVENIQREDLNPIETAEAYRRLIDECSLTQNKLAVKIGKSRSAITNTLRLNGLPDEIKQMLSDGRLTEGHARTLLTIDNKAEMFEMAQRIISGEMSVRQAEAMPKRVKRRRLIPKKKFPAIIETENYLKRLLGTSVKIKPSLKRGKIEIEYYNDEDLDRLIELFKKIER